MMKKSPVEDSDWLIWKEISILYTQFSFYRIIFIDALDLES